MATPHISLYKQLAPHLKIGVHKSNRVGDFNTISAVAAAIIVQLDSLFYYRLIYSLFYCAFNQGSAVSHWICQNWKVDEIPVAHKGLACGLDTILLFLCSITIGVVLISCLLRLKLISWSPSVSSFLSGE